MKAIVNDGADEHYIDEVDCINEGVQYLAVLGIAYYSRKDSGEDICSKGVHCDVDSEKKERWSEIS